MIDQLLTAGAAITTLIAAALGLLAATTTVHNNIDRFMSDLQWQGRLASWAAFANAIAAAILVYQSLGR